MSKNTLMVLALLVTLLSGWLVLSLAQKSQVSASTSGVTTPSSGTASALNGAPSGPQSVGTSVDINSGTKTSVDVK